MNDDDHSKNSSNNNSEKRAQRDANTARPLQSTHRLAEFAMAVVRQSHNFSPRHRPLPGGAGLPTFNQLEMVTNCTYRPSLVKIDARNFELSW